MAMAESLGDATLCYELELCGMELTTGSQSLGKQKTEAPSESVSNLAHVMALWSGFFVIFFKQMRFDSSIS